MTFRSGRVLIQVLIALAAVAAAALLLHYVPQLQKRSSLFLFLIVVLICTLLGELGSGIAAMVLSCAFIVHPIFSPAPEFNFSDPDDLLRVTVFAIISVLIFLLYTSRRTGETSLLASQQRLRLVLDSAYLGVWDYNLLTRKFWWSRTLETIYGREGEEFPKTYGRFFGTIHFDDQPMFNRAITSTIDEGTDYEVDHRIVLPDQSIRWVNTRGRIFFNRHSRAERIVGVTTDITDKKVPEHLREISSGLLSNPLA